MDSLEGARCLQAIKDNRVTKIITKEYYDSNFVYQLF